MSLCLTGNHSLDELEAFATANFNQVVDKNLSLRDFAAEGPIYNSETALGHFVKLVPARQVK